MPPGGWGILRVDQKICMGFRTPKRLRTAALKYHIKFEIWKFENLERPDIAVGSNYKGILTTKVCLCRFSKGCDVCNIY